jgi:hypothetical protein
LDDALAKAQGEFKKVRRNREGPYGMFADLSAMEDATKPALAKHGLCVRQTFIVNEDRSMVLVTRLSCKGEFTISTIPIPFFPNPQHTHSFCTYMARLGYSRILCLSVDDASDGEDIPEDGAEEPAAGPDAPPDLAAIKSAFVQAASADRVQALWDRVVELDLSKAQLAQAEKARDAAVARLKPKKEGAQ